MEKRIINFKASGQSLQRISGIVTAASDTVRYFEARFVLDESWEDFDSVRAIWVNGDTSSVRVLNHGVCEIPSEVLTEKNKLKVNLVGSTAEGGALVDRLTTFQCPVFGVTAKVPIDSPNPPDIPASQVEQFAEIVRDDADRADAAAIAAGASAQNASESMASASASETAAAASASNAADSAQASADSATASANSAAASASSASQSQGYAQAASESAGSASGSADRSLASAQASASSATDSANSATASANSASASQTFANNAELHAHNAEISAQSAENSADAAEQAKDTILGMRADATTLPEGSDATASYSDGLLMLGIPRGDKGNPPNLSIGTVETLDPDEDATATITGTAENPILSFGIPKGDTGEVSLQELEDATVAQTLSDSTPYNYRRTNNGNGAGVREYDEIVGASVAWNQIFIAPYSQTTYGITFTRDEDRKTIAISGTATATIYKLVQDVERTVNGHVYYVDRDTTNTNIWIYNDSGGVKCATDKATVGKATASKQWFIRVANGATVDETITPQITDVTLAFGSTIADYVFSMEQSTAGSGVTWLKTHFPKLFDNGYQPFDSGSIKSVSGLTAHEMVGKNLFDQDNADWVTGYFINASGVVSANGQYKYTDAYMQVSGSTQYAISCTKSSTANTILSVCFYDSTKTFIERITAIDYGTQTGRKSGTFTTTAETKYIRFSATYASSGGGTNDFQIEYGSTATDYEPYESHTYPLDSSVTLRGRYKLDANNQLYADGDVYPSSGEVTHVWGEVTFDGSSDEAWNTEPFSKTTDDNNFYIEISNGKQESTARNQWFEGYAISLNNTEVGQPNTFVSATGNLNVYFAKGLTTIEALRTYLASHPMTVLYELATPTTEQATPYDSPQWCDSHGTEEYVGSELPVGHNTDYPMGLADTIPKDDGSYTIQVDVANGKPSVSWVMPASASMIAPTEASYVATRNYTSGSLLIVNGTLYKATANIANNGNIVPGTNCVATTLAEVISALA